jgi:hypothetical protein
MRSSLRDSPNKSTLLSSYSKLKFAGTEAKKGTIRLSTKGDPLERATDVYGMSVVDTLRT